MKRLFFFWCFQARYLFPDEGKVQELVKVLEEKKVELMAASELYEL